MWKVWAVSFDSENVTKYLNESFERALSLLDAESRQRINRFYHKEDAFRLIARLLPRVLLEELNIPYPSATFQITDAGKPYVTLESHQPLGFNLTHDNGLIAMVYSTGEDLFLDAPAYRLGVDVMRLRLPHRQSLPEFIEIFSEQLTPLEQRMLQPSPQVEDSEVIRRFYLIWTLKEAYTKALGLGLGFDFRRVEYDVIRDIVRIDGQVPHGWEFVRFQLDVAEGSSAHQYVGVACRFVGDKVHKGGECIVETRTVGEWLQVFDAAEFVSRAIQELPSTVS
ncbi:unnamed protein product [Somion occarium]|uniref:holo-[acyl-carrier-protein] synthase n=1 Tax=Somion occarium TaxID=3059160 RepID=A0ABP1D335_9APHY